MCACDCVKVGREFRVDAHGQVLTVDAAGPEADSLRVVTMHPTTTSGEVEIRGWRHRRGQPDPDWWTSTQRVDDLPAELRELAPPPRSEGIGGAGATAGETAGTVPAA